MITRCNQCGTKFEISAELVKAEDPTVRCGECMAVFNARAHLVADKDDVPVLTRAVKEAPAEQPAVTEDPEITAAEMELAETVVIDEVYHEQRQRNRQLESVGASMAVESAGASMAAGHADISNDFGGPDRVDPLISPIDDGMLDGQREFEHEFQIDNLTGIEPDYNVASPALSPDRHLADAEDAAGEQFGAAAPQAFDRQTGLPEVVLDPDASLVSDELMAQNAPHYSAATSADSAQGMHSHVREHGGAVYVAEDDEVQTSGNSGGFFWPLLLLLAVSGAGLYFARDSIARMDLPLPVLSTFCSATGCELPVQKDLAQLELMRKKMFSHQSLDNVLVISVDLVNRAPFPQDYPVLGVTMANGEGVAVAERDFAPSEYLSESEIAETLPAGKPVRISFDIVDPGVDARSFELEFK